MSVTNSNAKSAVKTSRKAKNAASASDTVLSAVLAQTEEQHVSLSALVKSPQNVRIVPYSAESVRELADSVKGIGLLQNLVVHALPDGLYGVAAGGRRLAAMNLLATENTIPPDWPVRVKVVPDNLATAASLTENGQHLEMHPAEQIAGFRAMAAEGKTPAQTGDLLGYSPRHVQRMLKLAGLAPVYERQPEPVDNVSVPLLTRMCAERTLAVQAALMQQPEKSVALLAWTLCLNVFGSGAYNRPAQISLDCKHYSLTNTAPSGREGMAFLTLMQEGKRLETLLPEGWKQDFTTFFTLSTADLMALLSFCTACSLDGMQTRGTGGTTRSPLDKMETALAFHLRDWWQPTKADFFTGLKKPQIIAALNEAGLTGAARDAEKMKKGDAAELAEDKMRDNRWVPVWMRAPDAEKSPSDAENDVSDTENGSSDADSHHTLPDAA
ncbi:TPA: ParB/RepB/Spo0J family partition protein [Salmonella enterica subsp. enterica serovar Oranienburg]|nr:hypothetical protein [Salmonella enterica]EBQ8979190.1 hypothetical protein [Salmonella enterica subsp. enterica serovar Albany]EBW6451932.1 hypothetical protein [Salmonella enterica subsp. enterica serovar Oranienburg]ECA7065730.1 hypothetical protein [Salmonella enterica subsp. enterica serovar Grumpensis]